MKASEFKNLIKEAVREVIREELMEVVQQPVQEVKKAPLVKTGDAITDILAETRQTMTSDDYRNVINADSSMAQGFNSSMFRPKQNFNPTSDDPAVVQRSIASAPKVGLDISQLGFINKAAAIVNEADRKQKERYS